MDFLFALHLAGGIEGGLMSGAPHPTAIAEVGASIDYVPDVVGVGVSYASYARPDLDARESSIDLMLRIHHAHGRAGIGVGIRTLDEWSGVDWIRITHALPLASNEHASVDGYFGWTFGCYLGRAPSELPMRDVSCADTITSTYVFGVELTLSSNTR